MLQYRLVKREKTKNKGDNHKKKITANGAPGSSLAPNLTQMVKPSKR